MKKSLSKKIGKVAFKALKKGRVYIKTKKEVCDYESPLLLPSPMSGPTCPHVTLQVFLAVLYFVLALGEKDIEDLFGSDCKTPVFMTNTLFLYFSLQLMTKHHIFPFLKKSKVYLKKLRRHVLKIINGTSVRYV